MYTVYGAPDTHLPTHLLPNHVTNKMMKTCLYPGLDTKEMVVFGGGLPYIYIYGCVFF